ncbi:DNA-directed RNA polymerase subunit [Vibrio phage Va2]|nr:DNA-directed RNA polymerase subunit [Vibrio phage Va2]
MESIKMKNVRVSPETDNTILAVSHGRIETPGLFDFRRDRPVIGGLLCERIFGPMKDYQCSCGQFRSLRKKGVVCNTCKVEVNDHRVRRERFGHMELECAVVAPYSINPLSKFLGISIQRMEQILLGKVQVDLVQSEEELPSSFRKNVKWHKEVPLNGGGTASFVTADRGKNNFNSGPQYLADISSAIDSEKRLQYLVDNGSETAVSYLEWDPNFEISDLFLTKWLVMPADLRPANFSDSNSVESGINVLYRNVLNKSAQLKVIKTTPEHENYDEAVFWLNVLIQKAIEGLTRKGYESRYAGHIDSIVDGLKDKNGRFRENLLGKRVDYSGRSFITPDPTLDIDEVGIPEKMAIELLRPYIINWLRQDRVDEFGETIEGMTVKHATNAWRQRRPAAYEALYDIVNSKDEMVRPLVLLNRAPSLHRYSVQCLWMKLHKGKSITIPPEVCSPKNADFDGDTEAVHIILSAKAKREAIKLILPQANLLNAGKGDVTYNMSHEMIVGVYYLTHETEEHHKLRPIPARNRMDAIMQHKKSNDNGYEMIVQHPVKLKTENGWIDTTVGRCIVEEELDLRVGTITQGLDKGGISKVLKSIIVENIDAPDYVLEMTKRMRNLGFDWSTKMGLSICYDDCKSPEGMAEVVKEAEEFERNSPNEEMAARHWAGTTKKLEEMWIEQTGLDNPLKFMYMTKARVSNVQLRQMCIMKGQIAGATGDIVLVKNSLADGLDPFQYSLTCKGARQSFGANNEVVPQSGYLCRQMVHANRELHIEREGDTWATRGLLVSGKDAIGRVSMNGEIITEEMVNSVPDYKWEIQSMVTGYGPISTHECGILPDTLKMSEVGVQLGVITGQTFAEKTTQLGLRSKHLSGAISIADSSDKRVDVTKTGEVESIEETLHFTKVVIGGLTYLYHTEFVTMINKPVVGEVMEEGTVICVYSDSLTGADISGTLAQVIKFMGASNPGKSFNYPRSVVAPISGVVEYVIRKVSTDKVIYSNESPEFVMAGNHYEAKSVEVVDDFVNEYVDIVIEGQVIATVKDKTAITTPAGTYVESGAQLTFGLPDLMAYWKATQSIQLTWELFYKTLSGLFGESGVEFSMVHYEMAFRAMTEICTKANGLKGLRSKLNFEEGFTPYITGVNAVPREYPSLLKQLAFSHIDLNLKKSMTVLTPSMSVSSEAVMMGGLIPSRYREEETLSA